MVFSVLFDSYFARNRLHFRQFYHAPEIKGMASWWFKPSWQAYTKTPWVIGEGGVTKNIIATKTPSFDFERRFFDCSMSVTGKIGSE